MRLIDADALTAWVISELRAMPNGAFNNLNGRQAANLIGRAIDEMPTVYEWVSVENRMPEKEGKYLVLTSGFTGIKIAWFTLSLKRYFEYEFKDGEPDHPGFFDGDSEGEWIQDDVTHWMSLPSTEGLDET